ncbi:tyrosine-type recombinase/integrase [Paenibacillus sp. HW567]|uniref:tyrosine-type recombinase/integrase n=1 Tax=Paenibacillus sp. HW567 TaxID=1034769 RepID=UPI00037881FE|nr:tyrosine-type recombinase/integrase [Paenibacillus sp. HW567]
MNSTSPYLFVSRRSSKSSERGIQHIIEKYRDRTKIKHLSCHSLRHTFGHDLLAAGNDLQKVAMLMGNYKEDGTPNIEMIEPGPLWESECEALLQNREVSFNEMQILFTPIYMKEKLASSTLSVDHILSKSFSEQERVDILKSAEYLITRKYGR